MLTIPRIVDFHSRHLPAANDLTLDVSELSSHKNLIILVSVVRRARTSKIIIL